MAVRVRDHHRGFMLETVLFNSIIGRFAFARALRRSGRRVLGLALSLGMLFAVMLSPGVAGCAHAPPRPASVELAASAFARGDVLNAYRLLRSAPEDASTSRERERLALLAKATQATEHLIEVWLARSEAVATAGDPARALEYLEDLLRDLPADDPLRSSVAQRAKNYVERLSEARRKVDAIVAKADQVFQAGQIEEAHALLLEASAAARAAHLPYSLAHERLMVECERRAPELVATPKDDQPKGQRFAVRAAEKAAAKVEPPPSETPPAPAEELPKPGENLYQQGLQKLKEGQKDTAIALLQKALSVDPQHEGVRRELKKLSSYRTAAIQKYLGMAAEHFAREELDLAAPFYERVLELEPENLRAKEGLQMYQRFQELKKKQPQR